MNDILRLLGTIGRKRLLGTLVLGHGRNSAEIFFEEDLLYLPGGELLPKIDITGLDESGLLEGKLTESTIENTALGADLSRTIFPEVLRARNMVTEEEFELLARSHVREELFERLLIHAHSFQFQDGHVPDGLIGSGGIATRFPAPLEPFLELAGRRNAELEKIRTIIPSDQEVFVITEKGMAKKHEASPGFGARKILELLDGFRTLRSIIDDGPLFQYFVEVQIVQLLVSGWIKKTVVPEIQGLDVDRISEEEAERCVVYFKNAIRYGTDELRAREGYATLAERLGRVEDAAAQYNFIGDTLYKMGRKGLAIRAYQKGLALKKGDPLATDKIIRIFEENAEEAIERGAYADAATLYRRALQIRPDDAEIFGALLDLAVRTGDVSAAADVCDQAAEIARSKNDPAFAVGILERVITHFGDEPVFRKKLINLHLDFDMQDEAVDEMEALARLLIDGGQYAQGSELAEKALRLDPGRRHLRKLLRHRKLRRRRRQPLRVGGRLLTTATLLVILAICAYQLWSYVEFRKISYGREILIGPPGAAAAEPHLVETPRETRLRRYARDAEEYCRRFPFSIFTIKARRLEKEFTESAVQLERLRNHAKKKLLEDARALFDLGKDEEATALLDDLLRLGETDTWRRQAEEEIRRHRSYEADARELRRLAEKAISEDRIERAYELISRLVSEYPNADAAEGITFPVKIVVVPPELAGRLTDVPDTLHLAPNTSRKLTFRADGFEPVEVTIEAGAEPVQPLFFNQIPLWTIDLPSPDDASLHAHGDRVFYTDRHGDLHVVGLSTGKVMWTYTTPPLINPAAPVLVLPPYFLLPLNNSKVVRFGIYGEREDAIALDLDGFIQTPLLAASEESAVFGTSGRTIMRWFPSSGAVSATPIPEKPVRLALVSAATGGRGAAGTRDVIVLTESGTLYRVDVEEHRVVWKSRFRGHFARGPVAMGPRGSTGSTGSANVILATRRGEIVAIDGASGNIQWRRPRGSESEVAVLLAASQRILLSTERTIIEIDPASNRELRRWDVNALRPPFTGAVELSVGLAFFCPDGSFRIADPETLLTTWRRETPGRRIRAAASSGTHLVLADEKGRLSAFVMPGR